MRNYKDVFISEFGVYVEVCGAERTKDYERRRKVYHANHIFIIFVQTYKEEKKWKEYLVDSFVKIQLNRMEHLFGSLVGEIFD